MASLATLMQQHTLAPKINMVNSKTLKLKWPNHLFAFKNTAFRTQSYPLYLLKYLKFTKKLIKLIKTGY